MALSPQFKTKRQKNKGWSLLELLVVIGIIAVLCVITSGSMSVLSENARASKCIGNLRQVGMATFNYAAEHQGGMLYYSAYINGEGIKPASDSWWAPELVSKQYLKSDKVTFCPSLERDAKYIHQVFGMRAFNPPSEVPEGFVNLNVYEADGGHRVYTTLQLTKLSNLSEYPFYADSLQALDFATTANAGKQWFRFGVDPSKNGGPGVHLRHNNRANVLFADGHVETLNGSGLKRIGILSAFNRSKQLTRF